MPVKLIVSLICILVLVIFAGLNYNNTSDISIGFYQFQEVPVFVSLTVCFIAGALFSISLIALGKIKPRQRKKGESADLPDVNKDAAKTKPDHARGRLNKKSLRKAKKQRGETAPDETPGPAESEGVEDDTPPQPTDEK